MQLFYTTIFSKLIVIFYHFIKKCTIFSQNSIDTRIIFLYDLCKIVKSFLHVCLFRLKITFHDEPEL